MKTLIISVYKLFYNAQVYFLLPVFFLNVSLQAQHFTAHAFKEDIAVFTTREIYIAGENIPLTITTVDAFTDHPVDFSKYIYAELTDFDNVIVGKAQIKMAGYTGTATIPIDPALPTGVYALRLYSQWMRNYELENIVFIKIVNPYKTLVSSEINKISPAGISIFPEGGKLSRHHLNKLWYSISMPDMKVEDMQANLYEDDSLILSRKATFENSGTMEFKARKDKNYRIELVDDNKNIIDRQLLSFDASAGILNAVRNANSYDVTAITPENSGYSLKLLHTGTIMWEEKLNKSHVKKVLDFASLPDGMSYLIITNEVNEIVNWRPVLVHKQKHFNNVVVRNGEMHPVKEFLALDDQKDIKEAILSLQVYHEDIHQNSTMDFSVMTNPQFQKKPTRIKSENILFDPELKKGLISGSLKHFGNGKPAANKIVYMSVLQPGIAFKQALTDGNGKFKFTYEPAHEKMQFLFYANPGEEYLLSIDEKFSTKQDKINFPYFYLSEKEKQLVEDLVLAMQVNKAYQDVLYDDQKPINENEKLHSFFYGKPDETLEMEKYIMLPTMEEVFRELSRAIFLSREKGQLKINILDKYENRVIGPDPYVYIDGVLVKDHTLVFQLDPEIVESIHLLESRYYYGDVIMDGIIDIRTKNKNLSVFENFAFYSTYEVEGISSRVNNRLLSDKKTNPGIPFYPTEIFWQIRNQTRSISALTFPTPDKKGKYILTLHGIDSNGNSFTKSRIIQVE